MLVSLTKEDILWHVFIIKWSPILHQGTLKEEIIYDLPLCAYYNTLIRVVAFKLQNVFLNYY